MLSRGTRAELLPLAALLAMTAIWGSTFFLIKDVVTRIPVIDLLAVRFALAALALALPPGRDCGSAADCSVTASASACCTAGRRSCRPSDWPTPRPACPASSPASTWSPPRCSAALILRTRIGGTTWLAVLLAGIGLGVLSLHGFSIGYGELLTLLRRWCTPGTSSP